MSSRTQSRPRIKADILVVGIDVAKRTHVAAIRKPDGTKEKPFPFGNDRSGFERLRARSERTRERLGLNGVVFALEATGHYGHALRQYLGLQGYAVLGINPAHTKKAKELEDNSPEKSDQKDARLISDLAAEGRGRLVRPVKGVFAELRRLGKLRERYVVERVRLSNRYSCLVDLVFPELVQEVRKLTIRSIRRLLAEYPTAREIAGLELEELEDRLSRWSRRRLRPDKIARIHRLARESIGIVEGLETARMEMRQLLESLELVEQRLQEVEAAQHAALEKVPYAELLLTVPQLGSVTVATILGETGDLRNYKNAEMVIKMAGYNLYTISSGMFRGKTRITKRGRPMLRRYLFLAACRLSKKGAPLREFHERLTARKAKPQVLVGSCRKLLRLLVAMVRDGKPYEPGRLAVPFGEAA